MEDLYKSIELLDDELINQKVDEIFDFSFSDITLVENESQN